MRLLSVEDLHWGTAHIRHQLKPHALDYGLYPLPFKPYGRARTLPLDPLGSKGPLGKAPLKPFLSALMYLAYGVTSVRQSGAIPFLFRTVPSAGGLYPCHLYLGILATPGQETGVYYYDPPGHGLTQIRCPDQGGQGVWPETSQVPLVFVVTASVYNSAWKYRERALRYLLLDAGHLVQNLVMAAQGYSPRVSWEFESKDLASFLGLDLSWEKPLALVTLNWDRSVSDLVKILAEQTLPCFPDIRIRPGERDFLAQYRLLTQARFQGMTQNRDAAIPVWSGPALARLDYPGSRPGPADERGAAVRLPELMVRRRSCRNFIPGAATRDDLAALMDWVRPSETDPGPGVLAMACQGVEGLEDGLYGLEKGGLALMKRGVLHQDLARVCMGQAWIGTAAVVFLCLGNLKTLEKAGGLPAYQGALMGAGRSGQQVYLGAEALGWGCCGIGAFYDLEAKALLGLNGDAVLLYALAAGPVKKK